MSFCFIFSGTSEGRELSEILSRHSVKCLVFVATDYGKSVMSENENIKVHVGRLEADEIGNLIKEKNPDYIFDATHPHAKIITENIISACSDTLTMSKYVRVRRNIEAVNDDATVINASSIEDAVRILTDSTDGKIMLTTGVKELKHFCTRELKDRLIVRVLPFKDSIDEVLRCDIPSKAVIAMEGPFSEEMNVALINQYEAEVLVTKNSGSRGGFLEKINACRRCNIKAIVIDNESDSDRPGNLANTNYVSIDDAVKMVLGTDEVIDTYNGDNINKKNISFVATGVCDENYLTGSATKAIQDADLIIGAKRMTEFAKKLNNTCEIINEYLPDRVKETIDNSDCTNIAVLFSGDTGLCSGAKGAYETLKEAYSVNIIPGISSISYFASKALIQYSDYPFYSLHGREYNIEKLSYNGKDIIETGFIAICSGLSDVKRIASTDRILESKNMIIGYNLGQDDEKIINIKSTSDFDDLEEGLYVIAVI